MAIPSCRGSEAPKWTPSRVPWTACPYPNPPVLAGRTSGSWPRAANCSRTSGGISASTRTSHPENEPLVNRPASKASWILKP